MIFDNQSLRKIEFSISIYFIILLIYDLLYEQKLQAQRVKEAQDGVGSSSLDVFRVKCSADQEQVELMPAASTGITMSFLDQIKAKKPAASPLSFLDQIKARNQQQQQ